MRRLRRRCRFARPTRRDKDHHTWQLATMAAARRPLSSAAQRCTAMQMRTGRPHAALDACAAAARVLSGVDASRSRAARAGGSFVVQVSRPSRSARLAKAPPAYGYGPPWTIQWPSLSKAKHPPSHACPPPSRRPHPFLSSITIHNHRDPLRSQLPTPYASIRSCARVTHLT